jgi:membrane associated rhomboid family serine protease
MHLAFNMLTFYFFAFQLEAELGSIKFFVLYIGSMVLADVTSIIKNYNDPEYRSLGASGAISGVLFSYILFKPNAQLGILFFPIPIPASIFALLYLAFCYFASKKQYDMVNHEAHFWGAVAGVILTTAMEPNAINIFFKQLSLF